jgi:potassium-transporting ATPase KdpC subunit
MKKQNIFYISLKALALFTVLLGIVYPLFVMLAGQLLFYCQSNGSIVLNNNKVVGSMLIGQKFESDKYFTSRPSSINYNPFPSGGSNLSTTDKRLIEDFQIRRKNFINDNAIGKDDAIPSEMLFASGSGVDPHISKLSALMQLNRISAKRNLDKTKLTAIIDSLSSKRIFGLFGDEYVNVLELNLTLDGLKK